MNENPEKIVVDSDLIPEVLLKVIEANKTVVTINPIVSSFLFFPAKDLNTPNLNINSSNNGAAITTVLAEMFVVIACKIITNKGTELKTRENAVKTYLNNNDIEYTCRKYHISRSSIWRWVKKYDGTPENIASKKMANSANIKCRQMKNVNVKVEI